MKNKGQKSSSVTYTVSQLRIYVNFIGHMHSNTHKSIPHAVSLSSLVDESRSSDAHFADASLLSDHYAYSCITRDAQNHYKTCASIQPTTQSEIQTVLAQEYQEHVENLKTNENV